VFNLFDSSLSCLGYLFIDGFFRSLPDCHVSAHFDAHCPYLDLDRCTPDVLLATPAYLHGPAPCHIYHALDSSHDSVYPALYHGYHVPCSSRDSAFVSPTSKRTFLDFDCGFVYNEQLSLCAPSRGTTSWSFQLIHSPAHLRLLCFHFHAFWRQNLTFFSQTRYLGY